MVSARGRFGAFGSRLSALVILLPFFLLTSSSESQAQFTFTALEGISAAREMATDSLGANAELMMVATLGELDLQGFTLTFDLETGKAMAWIYVFRGKADTASSLFSVAVIKIFGFQTFSAGQVPLPASQLLQPVETSGSYANSDKMSARLKTDATYTKYRTDYPKSLPQFVTLGQVLPQGLPLPDEFPLAQSLWTVSFSGQGDSAMTCFVGTEGGETFCVRQPEFLSVAEQGSSQKVLSLAGPNPITGGDQIVIHINGSGVENRSLAPRLVIYNGLGQAVRDLSPEGLEAIRTGSERTIHLDRGSLPSGVYHLHLTTPERTERLPLILQ